MNWTALPAVFPSGMAAMANKLGGTPTLAPMSMVLHNRQWAMASDYVKHSCRGTGCTWYGDALGKKQRAFGAPTDPHAFFDWFFRQQDGWGLRMYVTRRDT